MHLKKDRYVLDTNIFGRLLSGLIRPDQLPTNAEFVICGVQREELKSTRDDVRRDLLLAMFVELGVQLVPAESFAWDIPGAGWGEAKWSDGERYNALRKEMDSAKTDPNNPQDALIAEVGMANHWPLITADRALAAAVESLGGDVVFLGKPQRHTKR